MSKENSVDIKSSFSQEVLSKSEDFTMLTRQFDTDILHKIGSVLVEISYRSLKWKFLWDTAEELEEELPFHFVLSRELEWITFENKSLSSKEAPQKHSLKKLLTGSSVEFKEQTSVDGLNFKIQFFPCLKNSLSYLKALPLDAGLNNNNIGLASGHSRLVHSIDSFPLQSVFFEGIPIFSANILHDQKKIEIKILESCNIRLDDGEDKALHSGDVVSFNWSDLFHVIIFYKHKWWRFIALASNAREFGFSHLDVPHTSEVISSNRSLWLALVTVMGLIGLASPFLLKMMSEEKHTSKIVSVQEVKVEPPVILPKPKPKPKPKPPEKKVVPKKKPPLKVPKPKPKPLPVRPKAPAPKPKVAPSPPKRPMPVKPAPPQPKPPPPQPKAPPPPVVMPSVVPKLPPPPPRPPTAQLSNALSFLSKMSAPQKVSSLPRIALSSNFSATKVKGWSKSFSKTGGFSLNSNAMVSGPIVTNSGRTASGKSGFTSNMSQSFSNVQAKVGRGQLGLSSAGFASSSSALRQKGVGKVASSAILKVLNDNASRFNHCYEKSLLINPNLAGEVSMQWSILTSGRASQAHVLKTNMDNAGLMQCLVGVLNQLTFPAPVGGVSIVDYSFVFSPTRL